MSYIKSLISSERSLWDSVVQHPLITDMCDDSLPIERFRDYMVQLRFVTGDGLRNLLCRLLADCQPEHSISASIVGHIQSLQPGGDHFEAITEMLKATGHPEKTLWAEPLPATEALCDVLYKIGVTGSVHEKLIAICTLVEITDARFEHARKHEKTPTNPVFAMWCSHHAASLIHPKLQWLHAAIDATMSGPSHSIEPRDSQLFKRIVQWVLLMNDNVRERGRFEFPLTHYYHKKEVLL